MSHPVNGWSKWYSMTPIQYVLIILKYYDYNMPLNIFWIIWVQLITIWYDYDYNTIQWLYLIILLSSKASTLMCTLAFKLWRPGELHPFSLSLPSISGPKLEIIKILRSFWPHWGYMQDSLAYWTSPWILQGKWTGLRHSCTLTLNRNSFGLYGCHQDYCTFSFMCCNRDQGLFELQLFMSWW